jgi:hypothetical protein
MMRFGRCRRRKDILNDVSFVFFGGANGSEAPGVVCCNFTYIYPLACVF